MRKFLLFLLAFSVVEAFAYDVEVNGIYYDLVFSPNQATVVGDYSNPYKGDIVIPDAFLYRGRSFTVTRVSYNAFTGVKGITSVVLPNTVTELPYDGKGMFEQCDSLVKVVLPESSLIASTMFKNCRSLKEVNIPPSCKSIPKEAFYGCTSLGPVLTIPARIKSIAETAFDGCSGIEKVVFKDTTNAMTITETDNVHYGFPFKKCKSLTEIYVGRPIGMIVFGSSESPTLKKMIIGKDLEGNNSLPNNYDKEDSLLTIVSYIEDPTQLYPNNFPNYTYLHGTLFVPKGTLNAYQTASGWKDFFDIREMDVTTAIKEYVSEQSSGDKYLIVNDKGMVTGSLNHGLNIIRHSNGKVRKVLVK